MESEKETKKKKKAIKLQTAKPPFRHVRLALTLVRHFVNLAWLCFASLPDMVLA